MTKWNLFSMLTVQGTRRITIKGVTGILASIEREDGSGNNFNVTLNTHEGKRTVFVTTID